MPESAAHLLVVEDDPELREVYQTLCREWKFTCDAVGEGYAALELFRDREYDAILLDLELPDVKGDHLAREFLKRKPCPPIIVVTGHGTSERAHRLGREGVFQFIQKPFQNAELRDSIDGACRRWNLIQSGVTEDELFELREVSLLMREEASRLEVLQLLLNSAARLTNASTGSIMLWDPEEKALVVEVVKGLPPAALGVKVPIGAGVAGRVFADGKPLLLSGQVEGAAARPDVRCSLCVPAVARGVPVGVINLNSTIDADFFSDRDLNVAAVFAGDAAIFLTHFDLMDELRRKVHELEEAQGSLHQMTERLLRTEKMSSVGTLAGGIAHQFNNLLAIIQSNLEMIRMKMVEPDVGIGKALDASRRAAEVAAGMLTFARNMRRTERVELSLRDLLARLVLVAGKELEAARVRVTTDLGDDPLKLTAAPGELQELFMNLLTNAREAMPDGGDVRIAARAEDGHIVADVADTGPGMPPEVRAKLFEPFFTTHSKSVGLGLWRVYNLVRGLGGTIDVASRPGEGTRFTLRLPVRPQETADGAEATAGR